MSKKLCDKDFTSTMSDSNSVFLNCGNEVRQMTIENFRSHLNDDDNQVLNDLAFYIDINSASSSGSTRVDVGGNDHMRQLWEDSAVCVLMDANGNYCELNRNDCRYTAEGEAIVDLSSNGLLEKWEGADIMVIIPQYYGRVQTVTVGSTTKQRAWFSPVPLPGGYIIPQQVVGKFKCTAVSSKLRSIPNATPTGSRTINAFWNLAQARSTNHGLANLDFRNHLLFHMMAKYGWRDCQNCKGSDGTLVWGVGLDGTENSGGWAAQNGIKTGHTLSLGMSDGNALISDANENDCHGVNVCGFENPWGQYLEMVQGLCSVGTDVYCWRGNFLPTGTPTAASFDGVDCVTLTRATSDNVRGMNIVANADGQGVYMIPKESLSGVTYDDSYSYNATGQLWLGGGNSGYGAYCGLACAYSSPAWSYSLDRVSARLAYYGDVNKVSPTRLAELLASA